MQSLKEQFTLFSVVAALVRAVAKLAYAASAANGSLRGVADEGDVVAVLDEVLLQLDNMLVLGTHISIMAEKLHAHSGVVQRMHPSVREGRTGPDSLEEVRELIASRTLRLRRETLEEVGPDTDRDDSLAEGGK